MIDPKDFERRIVERMKIYCLNNNIGLDTRGHLYRGMVRTMAVETAAAINEEIEKLRQDIRLKDMPYD